MNKFFRVLSIILLFLLSWVSSTLLMQASTAALAATSPQMKNVLALVPGIALISVALAFFLFTRILRLLCGLFLYHYDVELEKGPLQFAIYTSTAVTSLQALAQWILLSVGLLPASAIASLSSGGINAALKGFLTQTLPIGLPLALVQALVIWLFFFKKGEAERNKKLGLSFGISLLIWWAAGAALQLGSAAFMPH